MNRSKTAALKSLKLAIALLAAIAMLTPVLTAQSLCWIVLLAASPVLATDTNELHLCQKPPGKTPELFLPGIVSKKGSKEHCLAVSPKGDEMFFTTGSGWPHSKIMHVKKLGDNWSPAEPAAFLKNDWATQSAFSPDGRYLYFSSSRGKSDIRLYSIWRCKKTGDGWSEPENVIALSGDLIMEFHPSVDRDGSVYFLRWDFPNQTGDLYVARAEGDKLAEPVKLNAPISTEFNEGRPTADPLGRYLLFVSDRPGGCGGDDVYVCIRNADGTWSAPRNLGPEWNTAGDDDVPTVSPDGRYWFFEKNNDIYWKEAPAFPMVSPPPRPVSSSANPASKSE